MLPVNARQSPDGSVYFPMRGSPPPCNVPGYIEDPTDAYRWILLYVPCVHRKLNQDWVCTSGKIRKRDVCPLLQVHINPLYCKESCPYSQKVREGDLPDQDSNLKPTH